MHLQHNFGRCHVILVEVLFDSFETMFKSGIRVVVGEDVSEVDVEVQLGRCVGGEVHFDQKVGVYGPEWKGVALVLCCCGARPATSGPTTALQPIRREKPSGAAPRPGRPQPAQHAGSPFFYTFKIVLIPGSRKGLLRL